ncbi:MAG: hypothetical protein A2Y13_05355 [Planctomycetes bacterium GWC2_45_44]|nr:MAG: hypothetical protein A2Y13_05355 [Planctomycetes bacterium GWC2_45_44]
MYELKVGFVGVGWMGSVQLSSKGSLNAMMRNKTTNGKWIRPLDKSNSGDLAWPQDTTTPDSGNVVEHQTGSAVGHFIECVKNKIKSPLRFVNSRIIAWLGSEDVCEI